MSETSYYVRASGDLRKSLAGALPREVLEELHRPSPSRHFLVLLRHIALLALSVAGAASLTRWSLWLPCAVVEGFTLFGFTVLLHEVVHDAVFPRKQSVANGVLARLYAFPSGLSASQFTRWHLDHHAELGDPLADPKRHHLSPKRNARWFKALYLTPALFPIYFRAAARETSTYPPELQRKIRRERLVTVAGQLAILATLIALTGWWTAFKIYMLPYFLVFPVAFTLNRLGQHYNIDPTDPAHWSTLMKPSRLWDLVYLWSSYHLEHHYFPRVPFYNLRRLHLALRPFFAEHGLSPTTYRTLLWQWFVLNRSPHSNWALAATNHPAATPRLDDVRL